jgi:Brp/Blh family beta-carotene 15,15'-monooxygenase
MWFLFVIGQHLLIGGVVALRTAHRATVRREALGVAVLAVLFWRTDPLLGFAVYFGLWHSVAHLLVVMDALGPRTASQQALRVREFVRIAAPRSLISVVATIVFAGVAVMNGRSELLLPAVFVMVSLLTLPHMVVVEQLWRGTIGKSPLVR